MFIEVHLESGGADVFGRGDDLAEMDALARQILVLVLYVYHHR